MSGGNWTAGNVPAQDGRVAVITGANSGIGYETAAVLAARDQILAATPGADISVTQLDLTSLDSVRAAADAPRMAHPRIDPLINNAGVMWTPKETTKDGFGEQRGNPTLVQSSSQSHDREVRQRLWTVSEELTGVSFGV
ncbi:hypothetical protein MSAR_22190 [Mycolicibacterium sarraceniae]|uniref:Short-chain dehydrogenase n=1 Tax=Mycolicibacterium sarraceniae TaxID=1534348 RepID=A0A7I7SQQ8_9MYCO|nr:SDR family NAD(P)-dependent oxidoreductase [Mycolicibacterium sarraceniae]BBY59083.1 hypothetical protein MSAR_22190 [Mycolicibacterium sarraceniae]